MQFTTQINVKMNAPCKHDFSKTYLFKIMSAASKKTIRKNGYSLTHLYYKTLIK